MVDLKNIQTINADVLVIGGGGAGLRAAIATRQRGVDVLLTSESPVGFKNNTAIAGGIIAASSIWKGAGDSPEAHLEDTLSGGRFINDRDLVSTMTRGTRQQVYDLTEFGVSFMRSEEGEMLASKRPGHSYPRHVSASKGHNITRPMRQYAASIGVQFLEGIMVTRLIQTEGTVVAALGIDNKGNMLVIRTKSTILTTGGAGQIYLRTSNAIGLTGDGYALAYEAGTTLRDMEFVQFLPTAGGERGNKQCFYEGLIKIGATIRNSLGEDIIKKYGIDSYFSLTRDIIPIIVMKEISEGRGIEGNVIFDFTTIPAEEIRRPPGRGLTSGKVDPVRMPVAPTAHHFMGGIKINEKCETGIKGLYAAGEVCGGVHGSNRLNGNALADTFVFGTIAGNQAASLATRTKKIMSGQSEIKTEVERLRDLASSGGSESLYQLQQTLKQTMWDKASVIRDRQNLEEALNEIEVIRERLALVSITNHQELRQSVKLANMLTVSEMVCRSALTRTESRGAHYRSDYPKEDERWLKTIEFFNRNGIMMESVVPLSTEASK
ncbi:FAD-binding protein [Chloroflexota bacterium]